MDKEDLILATIIEVKEHVAMIAADVDDLTIFAKRMLSSQDELAGILVGSMKNSSQQRFDWIACKMS